MDNLDAHHNHSMTFASCSLTPKIIAQHLVKDNGPWRETTCPETTREGKIAVAAAGKLGYLVTIVRAGGPWDLRFMIGYLRFSQGATQSLIADGKWIPASRE